MDMDVITDVNAQLISR